MSEITFHAHPFLYSGIVVMVLAIPIIWCAAGLAALKIGPLDEDVPPSAGLRPEEVERPFPGPVIDQPALSDREHGRKVRDKDFEEKRWAWAAKVEAEMLVIEVEEGL